MLGRGVAKAGREVWRGFVMFLTVKRSCSRNKTVKWAGAKGTGEYQNGERDQSEKLTASPNWAYDAVLQ